jgi:hypothetical protein
MIFLFPLLALERRKTCRKWPRRVDPTKKSMGWESKKEKHIEKGSAGQARVIGARISEPDFPKTKTPMRIVMRYQRSRARDTLYIDRIESLSIYEKRVEDCPSTVLGHCTTRGCGANKANKANKAWRWISRQDGKRGVREEMKFPGKPLYSTTSNPAYRLMSDVLLDPFGTQDRGAQRQRREPLPSTCSL